MNKTNPLRAEPEIPVGKVDNRKLPLLFLVLREIGLKHCRGIKISSEVNRKSFETF